MRSAVEVKTSNIAYRFKRKDILGKYSELHLMYASIAEFGQFSSGLLIHFLLQSLISVDNTSISRN